MTAEEELAQIEARLRAPWEPVLARLRAEGFSVRLVSPAEPVQLEGVLPDGQRFYFRERGGDCYVGVGGDDPMMSPAWKATESLPIPFFDESDGYEVITRLLGHR